MHFAFEACDAKIVLEVPARHANDVRIALCSAARNLAANLGHLTFEATDTGFVGVPRADLVDGTRRPFDAGLSQAVFGQLSRDQEPVGNRRLLFRRVARELNHFHTVPQRRRDGVHRVGGRNEHHLREIKGDVQKVVNKIRVLLWIKNFE